MAGVTIQIDTQGQEEVQRLMRALVRRVGNLEPMFRDMGEALKNSVDARFVAGVDPDGSPWTPLSPVTLAKKTHPNILIESGLLRGINYRESPDKVKIGTGEKYGAIHQLGGQAGRGRKVDIPARPYLGLSADDQEHVLEIVQEYLERAG